MWDSSPKKKNCLLINFLTKVFHTFCCFIALKIYTQCFSVKYYLILETQLYCITLNLVTPWDSIIGLGWELKEQPIWIQREAIMSWNLLCSFEMTEKNVFHSMPILWPTWKSLCVYVSCFLEWNFLHTVLSILSFQW